MSDGGMNIQFFANATALMQSMDKAIKKQDEMVDRLSKTAKGSKAATSEMDRFAATTTRLNASPVEKYNTQLKKLDEALKAGKISQETFNRAVESAKVALNSAGAAREGAFGSKAIGQLTQFATGMVSLEGATRVFTAAMERAHAITQQTMANVEKLSDSRRQLNQVGNDSADIQALNDRADELAMKYGTSRETTRNMVFQARSVGFEGATDTIAKTAGANLLDMEAASRAAGKVPMLFQNKISPVESMSAVLMAAKASDLNFEQIAMAMPTAAEGAQPAGSSPAETIALLSTMAGRYKSADTAAERIKSFGAAIATNDDFKGQGIVASVERLMAMTDEQRKEFLGGNKDLALGYDALSQELPTFRKRLPMIQKTIDNAGRPDSFLEQQVVAAMDPKTQEGRLNQARAEYNRETVALEKQREAKFAEGGFGRATAVVRGTREMEDTTGVGPIQGLYGEYGMKAAEKTYAPSPVIEAMRGVGKYTGIGQLEQAFMRLLEASTKLYNNLTTASENQERSSAALRDASESLSQATGVDYTKMIRANYAASQAQLG